MAPAPRFWVSRRVAVATGRAEPEPGGERGCGDAGRQGRREGDRGARPQRGCGDGGVGGRMDGGMEARREGCREGWMQLAAPPPKFAGGDDRFQANAHLSCPNYTAGDEEQTPPSECHSRAAASIGVAQGTQRRDPAGWHPPAHAAPSTQLRGLGASQGSTQGWAPGKQHPANSTPRCRPVRLQHSTRAARSSSTPCARSSLNVLFGESAVVSRD